jgi:hypothetical protein
MRLFWGASHDVSPCDCTEEFGSKKLRAIHHVQSAKGSIKSHPKESRHLNRAVAKKSAGENGSQLAQTSKSISLCLQISPGFANMGFYHIDPLLLRLARRYKLWSQSRCDLPCRAMRPNNRSRVPGICQGVECALMDVRPALLLTCYGQSTIVTTLRLALHLLECRATGVDFDG